MKQKIREKNSDRTFGFKIKFETNLLIVIY